MITAAQANRGACTAEHAIADTSRLGLMLQQIDPLSHELERSVLWRNRRAGAQRHTAEAAASKGLDHRTTLFDAREERTPEITQTNGHDRHRIGLQDFQHPALERLQFAVAGDRAFRENAQQIAFVQHLAGGREGSLVGVRVFAARRNRDGLSQTKHPAQHGRGENAMVHDEANGPGAGRHDQDRVHETHMIADQHRRATDRNVLIAPHAKPVDESGHDEGHKTKQILGHQQEDVEGHHGIGQRQQQEDDRQAHTRSHQGTGRQRTGDHEECIENIVGCNDPRPMRRL